jgi:hypothetical protein
MASVAGRGIGRTALALAIGAMTLLIGPPTAPAAIQLGEAFPPSQPCFTQAVYLQTSSADNGYVVPAPGVINSYSVYAPPAGYGGIQKFRFVVGRQAGGFVGRYTTVGVSPPVDPTPGVLNTYPVQIPVLPGDVIGFFLPYVPSVDGTPCSADDYRDVFHYFPGSTGPGETYDYSYKAGRKIDIAATLETTPCASRPPTIAGTAGRDRLTGTTGPDVIVGLGGRDRIKGLGGRDVICGGSGRDVLEGDGGKDICEGGRGADSGACERERSL